MDKRDQRVTICSSPPELAIQPTRQEDEQINEMLSIVSIIASLTTAIYATCAHKTYLMRRLETAKFGYHYTNGPLVWHELAPEFAACKHGRTQSPIDIGL